MWIQKIVLTDIKSYEGQNTIELSSGINVLVGPNNGGKSTIANAALQIQAGASFGIKDVRLGKDRGSSEIYLRDVDESQFNRTTPKLIYAIDRIRNSSSRTQASENNKSNGVAVEQIPSAEPWNFIYPYLSKRKVNAYTEQVSESVANNVTGDLQNLYAKIDRLSNPDLPAHQDYVNACQKTLGFTVTCTSSPNGKKACYIIDNFRNVTVDNMGEGVASILGLLVTLSIAEGKLFVIEEPENDIHPRALKGLLELIIEKSRNNQFIITTHSNIVTRYLGSQAGTKIHRVDMDFDRNKLPTSRVTEIPNTPEARRELIEDLGYEFADMDLWEGWLILEEASAEQVVREHLIRWFAPYLQGKLRTFSARTVNEIETKFERFSIDFCFINLQPAYKNRAWVVIDGGQKEKEIIDRLRKSYGSSGWVGDHFRQFTEHDFEKYYPSQFQSEVDEILSIVGRKERQQKKEALREKIESWIREDDKRAKEAFEKSAAEVIAILREIEQEMKPK